METESISECEICGEKELIALSTELSLCQCKHCGFIFRNPRPTLSEITEYYSGDSQYDEWLSNERARGLLWRRRMAILDRYGRVGRLLDVGTGIGQFLKVAKERFEAEGTEVSSTAVELARSKYGLAVRRGAISDVDFG